MEGVNKSIMATITFDGNGYAMQPRIPIRKREPEEIAIPNKVRDFVTPSRVYARSSSTCEPGDNTGLCEKPAGGASMTLSIALGVALPAAAAIIVLIFLHRRNVKKQRREDAVDPHKSLDFGLDEGGGKKKRRSVFFGGEKNTVSQRQLSMDMNLSSPYLLPPGLQQSRESLHSLARTLHQNEDPYRPVAHYTASETGSIRSFEKSGQGSSIYTRSSKEKEFAMNARSPSAQGNLVAPPRQNSFPKSPITPQAQTMRDEPKFPEAVLPSPPPAVKENFLPAQPIIPEIETVPYPDDGHVVPIIQEPPKIARKGLPSSPSPPSSGNHEALTMPKLPEIHTDDQMNMDFNQDFHANGNQHDPAYPLPLEANAIGLGVMGATSPQAAGHMSPPSVKSLPSSPHPQPVPAPQGITPVIEEAQEYYDYDYQQMPPQNAQHGYDEYDGRGRTPQRQSSLYQQADQQGGLNVPGFDSKRLSVGFRPLPPDEFMETEDPETRANRIRSFYKEYFDDSKQDHAGGAGGHAQYYEDYDQNYLGDTAFFDPDSNQFIMPYAQPVGRRAMTPPPSGSRFPGPRRPGPRGPGPRGPGPRPHAGSIGGMSMPGGFRPGSAASSGWGPRPGSSASAQFGRAGSAMSGKPRKPMPPPAALPTLPTPSKLKDDNFALFNAMDFAPPESFGSRARGRSQSPLGERRAYKPTVPAASPLVSSYDEVAALPSPHLLRKSSTFTGLDFAPPRKFKDSDTMSDAGSIRSNRSGISAVSQAAIRSGAGRVSRLPGDTIFTQAQMGDKLKPSWSMRDL